MSKTAQVSGVSIQRENTEWGVRLIVKPLPDAAYANMEISVEITHPKPGRNPEMRTRFTGTPVSSPLRPTDQIIWVEALKGITEYARAVAGEMKEPVKKSPTKKAAKKPAKKAAKG
jgi:hypothetical protein